MLRTAVIQVAAGSDKAANLSSTLRLISKAIRQKAKFITLPEVFLYRGDPSQAWENAETIDGEAIQALASLARKHRVWILAGSMGERSTRTGMVYNTSVLLGPSGKRQAVYRKIHRFDMDFGPTQMCESRTVLGGKNVVATKVGEFTAGLSICFDLRFPELYRQLVQHGANLLCVPSSFTHITGQVHWELLLRARAVENQCYVLAPNQSGIGSQGVRTYGNSMIIDPWGRILKRASENGEAVLVADLDLKLVKEIRKRIPMRCVL